MNIKLSMQKFYRFQNCFYLNGTLLKTKYLPKHTVAFICKQKKHFYEKIYFACIGKSVHFKFLW
jgi:hypothetical protein